VSSSPSMCSRHVVEAFISSKSDRNMVVIIRDWIRLHRNRCRAGETWVFWDGVSIRIWLLFEPLR
jgi:hypothetical protein